MTAFTRRHVWIVVLATLIVLGSGLFAAWAQNQTYTNGTVLYFQDNSGSLSSSTFLFADPANRLNLGAGNATRVTVTPQGSVGIGTMNPAARFEIAGGNQVMGNNNVIYFRDSTGSLNNAMYVFGDSSNRLNIGAGNVTRLTIANSGNIGIGTSSPAARFHVAGDAQVDGNIAAKYQDVAEWVKSDRPGILLGEAGGDKLKVAQSGRVKVKVDATFGPVAAGDLLVTSPNPGYAMRSTPIEVGLTVIHRPGTLLGKALEPLREGQGEILVLLTLQ